MRHGVLLAVLSMTSSACGLGVGSVGTGSTAEADCYSQNTSTWDQGWAFTWAGASGDRAYGVAPHPDGVILVAGYIGDADFRGPSGATTAMIPGAAARTTLVAKLGPDGAVAWQAELPSRVYEIRPTASVGPDGSVYVVGVLEGSFDFDPGPGEDVRTSTALVDVYLTKLSRDGAHLWTRTWAADRLSVAVYGEPLMHIAGDGSVLLMGRFADPALPGGFALASITPDGTVAWAHTLAHPVVTAFTVAADGTIRIAFEDGLQHAIATYDAAGALVGTRDTWNGSSAARAVATAGDGATIVVGRFYGSVDFDPGPAIDLRIAEGWDAFAASYAADGSLRWVNTWGSRGSDEALAVAVGANDTVFVAGSFHKTVDFDPGAAVDERTSRGEDAALAIYGADGGYQGARTWGGADADRALAVATTPDGRAYVAGTFTSDLNFASNAPADVRDALGHDDGFLLAVDASGAVASGPACIPASPAGTQTDPRLAGTGLPGSYLDCATRNPDAVYYDLEGDGVCTFVVGMDVDAALYGECARAGGGIIAGEGSGDSCKIVYSESAGPCFGNACD